MHILLLNLSVAITAVWRPCTWRSAGATRRWPLSQRTSSNEPYRTLHDTLGDECQCSVAALYVAERMRNEVVATVAAHFQQLALAAARRRALHAAGRKGAKRHEPAKVALETLHRTLCLSEDLSCWCIPW